MAYYQANYITLAVSKETRTRLKSLLRRLGRETLARTIPIAVTRYHDRVLARHETDAQTMRGPSNRQARKEKGTSVALSRDDGFELLWPIVRARALAYGLQIEQFVIECMEEMVDAETGSVSRFANDNETETDTERTKPMRKKETLKDPDLIASFEHVPLTWIGDHEPRVPGDVLHAAMGLAGEVGELVDMIKKLAWKKTYNLDLDSLEQELGDIGYYWAALVNSLGWSVSEVMDRNAKKLADGHGWVEAEQ